MQNQKIYLRTLRIIHFALISGQVLFMAVCIYLKQSFAIIMMPADDPFFFIVPSLALASLAAGSFINGKLPDNALKQNSDAKKLEAYRALLIVRYALIEGPSLFALIAYFLSGNFFYILVSAFLILFMLMLKPSREKIEMDLHVRLTAE